MDRDITAQNNSDAHSHADSIGYNNGNTIVVDPKSWLSRRFGA